MPLAAPSTLVPSGMHRSISGWMLPVSNLADNSAHYGEPWMPGPLCSLVSTKSFFSKGVTFSATMAWPCSESPGHAFDSPRGACHGPILHLFPALPPLHHPGSTAKAARLLAPLPGPTAVLPCSRPLSKLAAAVSPSVWVRALFPGVLFPGPHLTGTLLPSSWWRMQNVSFT